MDYLDPVKRRAHNIRLFIGYVLMAVVIAIISIILLFQSYGYDINRKTGQVIQNGLVYLDSHPVSATAYVNGTNKGKTNLKLVIPADTYKIELKASGYRPWQKTVRLDGGSIEQIIYPFLFPTKLVTSDQQLFADMPQLATQSPDRRWLLVQPSGPLTHFEMFDISSKTAPQTSFDLPAGLLSPSTGQQTLSVVEWSTDNKHVLLKHTFDNSFEFIVMDRTAPAEAVNLNKALALNPTSVSLRDKRYDRYYLYDATAQTVSTDDLKAKQAQVLLTKTVAFKAFGANTVLYVAADKTDEKSYDVRIWDGNKNYTIHKYPASGEYLLETASFSGSDYVVVTSVAKGATYIYKNPLDAAKNSQAAVPFMLLKVNQPRFISFSANTRFIAVQSGSNFAVYDIDTNRRFYYKLNDDIGADVKASWMDGHRLDLVSGSQSLVFDFDGTNQQKLSASSPSFTPYFDSGYGALYNLAPSVNVPKRYALTRTLLTLQ